MSAITQCSACNTRFKVTQEQLDVHQGLVRCGRCQTVFNAKEHLQDDQPSPQLDLLTVPETPAFVESTVEASIEIASEPIPEPIEKLDFSLPEPIYLEPQVAEQQNAELQNVVQQQVTPHENIETTEPLTLAQQIVLNESPRPFNPKPTKRKSSWPWLAGNLLLLIILLAQVTYYFRIELAASQPGFKPALISYCRLLQCSVPLPQKADLMSIESSELEADPAQSSVITLNALLRNHASYMQAFPNLELTLTDAQEKPLARRTFRPTEYLKPGEDEKQGLAANRELSVKLNLDTTDLKPSGYRLLLFYPQ